MIDTLPAFLRISLNKMNIRIIKGRARRGRWGEVSFDRTKNEYRKGHLKVRREKQGDRLLYEDKCSYSE